MSYITQYEMKLNSKGTYEYKDSINIRIEQEDESARKNTQQKHPFQNASDIFFETYLSNMFTNQ